MDDGLKQRLVGAVVLAAIAVIFLPSLFDQDSRSRIDTTSKIPPRTLVTAAKFEAPVRPETVSQAPDPEAMYELLEDEPVPAAKNQQQPEPEVISKTPSVGLNDKGVPKGWVIQVASYKKLAQAEALKNTLIEEGYKAYVHSLTNSKGKVSRVMVGPKIDQKAAQKVKKKLDQSLNVDTLIKRFEP